MSPDPLEVVVRYPALPDRELAALFCSSFALGRASAIVGACSRALAPFGPRPASALADLAPREVLDRLGPFVYRFFGAPDAAFLLCAAAALARRRGGLERAFLDAPALPERELPAFLREAGEGEPSFRLLSRCAAFAADLRSAAAAAAASAGFPGWSLPAALFPSPADGSACKRPMLFLRWLCRCDSVDPGGWPSVSPSELVLPLDTHLHRVSLRLGLTERRAPDLRAALEATAALRLVDPADPTRFDFSLSRLGIRSDYSLDFLDRS